jgi:energy-coupling factor transporter ATP-binding protein EcfA2
MTNPLSGKRIVVCGKGGCGKSSIVALMAQVLREEAYRVIVLDGDASNPGGVARLIFGPTQGPAPLLRFFGGRKMVECPVDNPAPLTRMHDPVSSLPHLFPDGEGAGLDDIEQGAVKGYGIDHAG